MTPKKHKERHVLLHKQFDELFSDYILHAGGRPTNTILDLVTWSFQQTIKLDHRETDKEVAQ